MFKKYFFYVTAGLGDLVEDVEIFPYNQVPNFPMSTAPGKINIYLSDL